MPDSAPSGPRSTSVPSAATTSASGELGPVGLLQMIGELDGERRSRQGDDHRDGEEYDGDASHSAPPIEPIAGIT